MSDTKPSNPKEAFSDAKMPLDLLPDTAVVQFNLALLEGALKYGQYSWRVAGVRTSTYVKAARRHLSKFWNGQDADPLTLVQELASVGACVAIMLDAIACGKLNDDRPPRADMEKALAEAAKIAAHLKQLFKDHNPPQYREREHGASAVQAPPLLRHHGTLPTGMNRCLEFTCWCHAEFARGAHLAHFNPDEPPDMAPRAAEKCSHFDGTCTRDKGHRGACWVPTPTLAPFNPDEPPDTAPVPSCYTRR